MERVENFPGFQFLTSPGSTGRERRRSARSLRRCADIWNRWAFFMSRAIGSRAGVEAVRDMSKAFFALPESDKLKIKIDRNFRGYLPFAGSTIVTSSIAKVSKPNQSESIFFLHEVAPDEPRVLAGDPLHGPNQWPDETVLLAFARSSSVTSRR
jgi:isopenicillin N synthase-like dioxygenase